MFFNRARNNYRSICSSTEQGTTTEADDINVVEKEQHLLAKKLKLLSDDIEVNNDAV